MYTIESTKRLLNYRDWLKYGNKFIETGSAGGDGIQRALDAGFQEVHSIEAKREWYEFCQKRFEGDSRVILHHGRSNEVLKVPLVKSTNAGVIFFLDAHPAGVGTAGDKEIEKFGGESEFGQNQIILAELEQIIAWYYEPIIMIDDQKGLTPHAAEYIKRIREWNKIYQFRFYDENLGAKHLYEEKILVAYPGAE